MVLELKNFVSFLFSLFELFSDLKNQVHHRSGSVHQLFQADYRHESTIRWNSNENSFQLIPKSVHLEFVCLYMSVQSLNLKLF